MLGVETSTVAGRLMIARRSGVGFQMSSTLLHISSAKSSSVAVKVSGEYSKRHSVSGRASVSCLMIFVALVAISMQPSRSRPNTVRRNTGEVAL